MGTHATVTSKEHQGNEVTYIVWSNSNTLFASDDVGRISILQLQSFIVSLFIYYHYRNLLLLILIMSTYILWV